MNMITFPYRTVISALFMFLSVSVDAQENISADKVCGGRGRLVPRQIVLQYAGNMGLLSAGVSWSYGRHQQWETDVLAGFLPKYNGESNRMTFTVKENYIPWNVRICRGWDIKPLTCGVYMNAISGHEFWLRQPGNRYPAGYYEALSTRYRINLCVGQRVEKSIPDNENKFIKSLIAFYELSVCDLYLRALVQDGFQQPLHDVATLSLGVRARI